MVRLLPLSVFSIFRLSRAGTGARYRHNPRLGRKANSQWLWHKKCIQQA